MTAAEIRAKRADLLAIAKSTVDPGEKHWCKVFIANLDLMASDDDEERERGTRTFKQNVDWYTRLFLPTRNSRG